MKKLILTFLLLLSAVTYAQELQKDSLIYSTRTSCSFKPNGAYNFIYFTLLDTGATYTDSIKVAVITRTGTSTNPNADTLFVSALDIKNVTNDTLITGKEYRADNGGQLKSKRTYLVNFIRPEEVILYFVNLQPIADRKARVTFNGKNYKQQ